MSKQTKSEIAEDDAYKQVSLPQLPRGDIRGPSLASYNYYTGDRRDSVGEHIYEVIDDTLYDVIKPGPCQCVRGPRGPGGGDLVRISLDMSSSAELTSDNYSNTRQFNSLKSFKSHRNRSYI